MKMVTWIILISVAAVTLTYVFYPKLTLLVATIMPGTPP